MMSKSLPPTPLRPKKVKDRIDAWLKEKLLSPNVEHQTIAPNPF
jgi:hypothetical protein